VVNRQTGKKQLFLKTKTGLIDVVLGKKKPEAIWKTVGNSVIFKQNGTYLVTVLVQHFLTFTC
jgi:hypothetical protein